MSSLVKPLGKPMPSHSKPSKLFWKGKSAPRFSLAILLARLSSNSLSRTPLKKANWPSVALSATYSKVGLDISVEPPFAEIRLSSS